MPGQLCVDVLLVDDTAELLVVVDTDVVLLAALVKALESVVVVAVLAEDGV
jgi:hypothetical protein